MLGKHRTALERQILEAIMIEEDKPQIMMNNKAEFGRNFIPRLMVEPETDALPPNAKGTPPKQ